MALHSGTLLFGRISGHLFNGQRKVRPRALSDRLQPHSRHRLPRLLSHVSQIFMRSSYWCAVTVANPSATKSFTARAKDHPCVAREGGELVDTDLGWSRGFSGTSIGFGQSAWLQPQAWQTSSVTKLWAILTLWCRQKKTSLSAVGTRQSQAIRFFTNIHLCESTYPERSLERHVTYLVYRERLTFPTRLHRV